MNILEKSITLDKCVEILKERRKYGINIEHEIDIIAVIFGLDFDEVERLVIS